MCAPETVERWWAAGWRLDQLMQPGQRAAFLHLWQEVAAGRSVLESRRVISWDILS